VGLAAVLATSGLLAFAVLPAVFDIVCVEHCTHSPGITACSPECTTFGDISVAAIEIGVITLSTLAVGRIVRKWYLRVLVLLFMFLAWDPIQHTLAVRRHHQVLDGRESGTPCRP
jgi:hypothetical protein